MHLLILHYIFFQDIGSMRWPTIQQDNYLHVWVALPNLLQESQCSFLGSALRQAEMGLASHTETI